MGKDLRCRLWVTKSQHEKKQIRNGERFWGADSEWQKVKVNVKKNQIKTGEKFWGAASGWQKVKVNMKKNKTKNGKRFWGAASERFWGVDYEWQKVKVNIKKDQIKNGERFWGADCEWQGATGRNPNKGARGCVDTRGMEYWGFLEEENSEIFLKIFVCVWTQHELNMGLFWSMEILRFLCVHTRGIE